VKGVRQGGILSPFLFSVFVDNVLLALYNSGLGCYIKSVCYNSLMYADDLLLLAISVTHLCILVKLCNKEFNIIHMKCNIQKSACLRIGDRHSASMASIVIDDDELVWKQEIKYLGVSILSSKRFTFNLQPLKQKFFKSVNGLFGKVGTKSSPVLLCSLIDSFCTPIVLYASESLTWTKRLINSLDNAFSQAFYKIFNTFDKKIISQCQFYMGYLPMNLAVDLRKLNFYLKLLYTSTDMNLHLLFSKDDDDFNLLCNKYDIHVTQLHAVKYSLWAFFEATL
jgi:hypothetical protein